MMIKAHKLASKMVGNYSARLALALRQLWSLLKKEVAKMKCLVLKHQHNLASGKKWDEMTLTQKVAERELTLSEDVKLGYMTVEQFEKQLQREIESFLVTG